MKIYTKSGDKGMTSLYDGSIIGKNNKILDCIGDIDELNSEIGYVISILNEKMRNKITEYINILTTIQSLLFDMGGIIANPSNNELRFDIDSKYVNILEKSIDNMTEVMPKLVNFILPGGNLEMASLHRCRTICRRAERRLVDLKTSELDVKVDLNCYIYINRLSDFLFTLSRYIGYIENIDEIIYRSGVN